MSNKKNINEILNDIERIFLKLFKELKKINNYNSCILLSKKIREYNNVFHFIFYKLNNHFSIGKIYL